MLWPLSQAGLGLLEPELFDFLKASVKPTLSVAARGSAAGALKKSTLSPEQRLSLVDSVREAGPLELPSLLACFEGASDEALGTKLLAALEQSKGLISLRSEVLKPVLEKYPTSVQKKGETLLASLEGDSTKQKAHLEKLLASMQSGDVRRGQTVFNSVKAACSACHTIGYMGGKVGPDSDTDRPGTHGTRSARSDRLSERQFCAQLRAAGDCHQVRRSAQRRRSAGERRRDPAGHRATHGSTHCSR